MPGRQADAVKQKFATKFQRKRRIFMLLYATYTLRMKPPVSKQECAMSWKHVIFSCFLVLLPSLAAAVSGNITVEGRIVPLPPGDWREVARATEVRTLRYTGQAYQLGKVIL